HPWLDAARLFHATRYRSLRAYAITLRDLYVRSTAGGETGAVHRLLMAAVESLRHNLRDASIASISFDRCRAWRRHDFDGDRSRASVRRGARGWAAPRRIFHALDHQLRRARVRISLRHLGVPARPETGQHARAVALSADAWTDPRAARAHRDSRGVDLQLPLRRVSACRCDLDARLVHGVDVSAGVAASRGDRCLRCCSDLSAQHHGFPRASERDTRSGRHGLAVAEPVLRRTDPAR